MYCESVDGHTDTRLIHVFLGYLYMGHSCINNMAIVLLFSACAGSNECTTDGHYWELAYWTMHNCTQFHLYNVTSHSLHLHHAAVFGISNLDLTTPPCTIP